MWRALAVLALGAVQGWAAFPTGWGRKCALTIDHTKVSAAQTDFPVLIGYNVVGSEANLPQEMLVSGGGNAAKSDGADIRFSSDAAGATPLHAEVVIWTQHATTDSSRHAEIHVKIPSLSSTVDTVIYVWYKNTSATAPAANDATFGSQGVWDANYKGVWHLRDGSVLSANDSTGINNGAITGATAGAGKIGGSGAFSGSAQYINAGTNASLGVTGAITIEAWIKPTDFANYNGILGKSNAGGGLPAPYDFYLTQSSGIPSFWKGNGTIYDPGGTLSSSNGSTAPATGVWSHIAVTMNGSNSGTVIHYLNGSANGSTSLTFSQGSANGSGAARIASRNDSATMFKGGIDEVRLSSIARSGSWISTQYNNQSSPATFWSVATPVSLSASAPIKHRVTE